MHWEFTKFSGSFFCDIGFIVVVWSQACIISRYACILMGRHVKEKGCNLADNEIQFPAMRGSWMRESVVNTAASVNPPQGCNCVSDLRGHYEKNWAEPEPQNFKHICHRYFKLLSTERAHTSLLEILQKY